MFSGTLKDLAGKPLTGPVDLHFSIYKEQADAAPLWQETQTLQLDEQGHYTVLLGGMQPNGLPLELFTTGEARWLGVAAGTLPEQPRTLLVSVPYALKANDAEMLGGKPASAYMLAPTTEGATPGRAASSGSTQAGVAAGAASQNLKPGKSGASPKPYATPIATNYIPIFTSDGGALGSSVMYQSGNNIGVGTLTPLATLDVNGRARVGYTGATGLTLTGSQQSSFLLTNAAGAGGFNLGRSLYSDNGQNFFVYDRAAGATRLFLDASGNLGIGTTAPAAPLHVNGKALVSYTGFAGLTLTGSQQSGLLLTNAAGAGGFNLGRSLASDNSQNFFVYDRAAGAARLFVNSAGNVGIGTTSPVAPLDTFGPGYVIGRFVNNGSGPDHTALVDTENGDGVLWRYGVGGTGNGLGLSNGQFYIERAGFGVPVVIEAGGNVGIGRVNPAVLLDVGGRANFSGIVTASAFGGDGSGLSNVNAATAATATNALALGGVPASGYLQTGGGTMTGTLTLPTDGLVAGSTQLVLQNGSVGIGATPASTEKFLVYRSGAQGPNNFGLRVDYTTTDTVNPSVKSAGYFHSYGEVGSTSAGLEVSNEDTNTLVDGIFKYGLWVGSDGTFTGGGGTPTKNYGLFVVNPTGADENYGAFIGGSVGIGIETPATKLQVRGDIRLGTTGTNGCIQNYSGSSIAGTCSSDARLKTDVHPFQPVLSQLVQLRPVQFYWKADEFPEMHFGRERSYGLLAQEVEKVFPEMVGTDEHRYKTVDYTRLPLLLLQAVKEQQIQIRDLSTENRRLREQVGGQQAQIVALNRQVQELERVQGQMASLQARLAQLEARTANAQPKTSHAPAGVKRATPTTPAGRPLALAKVQF